MSRLVGESRDGKGEEEEDRDEEEGKKGEAQLSYPSQDPPLDIAAVHHIHKPFLFS